jgi:uncharacterized protein (UPF0371 family)
MARAVGFDGRKYLEQQTQSILERVERFGNKLYLEFGGKLIWDYHAARVLPGFDPNAKMHLLQGLKDRADLILCIYAGDIERKKIRADFGITYDADALKLIDDLHDWGLPVRGVVITRFEDQPAALQFKNKLERRDVRVCTHRPIPGYPADVERIVGPEGYGKNDFIETTKPLVVVTGPGPNSGKLSTCLSQLYHERQRGLTAGYAKFETFPIWNLPLDHPVNIAYEAATVDINDYNTIDPHHLAAYATATVNYNRDVAVFPIVKRLLERITGAESVYRSPTDMGVNRAGFGIVDDDVVREAARQEIIRRQFRARSEYAMGIGDKESVERLELIMKRLDLQPEGRSVVPPAREAATRAQDEHKGNEGVFCGAAIELRDGTVVTGNNSPMMHAASSVVINAIKHLSGLPKTLRLLPPMITESIANLKKNVLNKKTVSLDLEETLIALSISATVNPGAQLAMERLKDLAGCEVHLTHLPTPGDEGGLRRLGVNLTSDPNFPSRNLFNP